MRDDHAQLDYHHDDEYQGLLQMTPCLNRAITSPVLRLTVPQLVILCKYLPCLFLVSSEICYVGIAVTCAYFAG